MRINKNQFQTYSRIIKNQWESMRITENHWELAKIRESLRIIKNHWESSGINENQSSDLFENHWESSRINFILIWESVRIIANQWESVRIIENHIKNKVLPLQWSKAKWHRYMKITVFIVILIDMHWFCESFSFSFPLSQIHRHRPHSCRLRLKYCLWLLHVNWITAYNYTLLC